MYEALSQSDVKFAPQEEKTMINEQLPFGNMESLRTQRQRSPQKVDVTHTGICPWIETEAKTWNEVEAAQEGGPGETRKDVAASWSQVELMELTSELAKERMQDDSCKMEVQKYKELYLKELRSNNALLSRLQNRTCKCSERSCSNHGEEMRWKTSSMVALVGPCPECPQVPYLTSSTMEPQGNVSQPSQCPEARCECMENPRSLSEDKEKVWLELISSVRFLHCALHRETRRTKELQKELAEMKKIFNMPPQQGRGHEDRRHSCREVSKVSQAEMGVPVAMIRLEGEATTAENLVCVHETPSASLLTKMELEMESIKSAIAEVNTQERLAKKELEVIKHLYRGELEHIDNLSVVGAEHVNVKREKV
ncbi:ankyrin repeat domain-containing protein 26 isoform X2 [Mus pahari]|uniref:ankyrin repeat domain-containing protein 26 isoform X2 n=1 Tax=Mus pahari TaxID=10093 RepID=UPI000A30C78B|nr:ankyrin repeat domain-containing protein 26 isoform X2 [Mus pahari]